MLAASAASDACDNTLTQLCHYEEHLFVAHLLLAALSSPSHPPATLPKCSAMTDDSANSIDLVRVNKCNRALGCVLALYIKRLCHIFASYCRPLAIDDEDDDDDKVVH